MSERLAKAVGYCDCASCPFPERRQLVKLVQLRRPRIVVKMCETCLNHHARDIRSKVE